MKENKVRWAVGFLIAGLVLLALSASLTRQKTADSQGRSRLGRVTHESGTVSLLHPSASNKESIQFSAPVYHLDSVETDSTGDAKLDFESGGRLRLFPSSLITVTRENDTKHTLLVILKHGDIKVEKVGTEPWSIAKNGERLQAAEYNGSELQRAALIPSLSNTTASQAEAGLSEAEISSVMSGYRSAFFKCYTQLLQKDSAAKGDVSLSFTVENTGKMSAADVVSSRIQNDNFKKCLLEVLRRIEFRSFSGPPVSALFPLKFE